MLWKVVDDESTQDFQHLLRFFVLHVLLHRAIDLQRI